MKASEIAEGMGHAFSIGRRAVAVARVDGELIVLNNSCPHMGCESDWDGSGWECPCHGSKFAVDGAVTRGPAEEPMEPLAYRVEDDEIVLQ